jgi:membrane associated rhomboid family serine protease
MSDSDNDDLEMALALSLSMTENHSPRRSDKPVSTVAMNPEVSIPLTVLDYPQDHNGSYGNSLPYISRGSNYQVSSTTATPYSPASSNMYANIIPDEHVVSYPTAVRSTNTNNDLSLARMLQALEFEIDEETYEARAEVEMHGEFERKEYHASGCSNQLQTISTFICFAQIVIFIVMLETEGVAPSSENPMYGPSGLALVKWGAKDAALIIYRHQWWRLFTPIILHAGVIHLLSNVLIQLRIGGYLNLVFGSARWVWIYFISGVFGNMCSCLFLPNTVGVGSSGALLGILAAWIVWIVFRWNKIPEEAKPQRNCQMVMVCVAVGMTLALSFTPLIDWAAHFGGALAGILWGMALLADELDVEFTRNAVRYSSLVAFVVLFSVALDQMINHLHPTKKYLDYYDDNGVS